MAADVELALRTSVAFGAGAERGAGEGSAGAAVVAGKSQARVNRLGACGPGKRSYFRKASIS